jgi:hypothetical protein
MSVLPAKSFHFTDGHPIDAHLIEGVLHFVQFGKLDRGFNLFHPYPSLAAIVPAGLNRGVISKSPSLSSVLGRVNRRRGSIILRTTVSFQPANEFFASITTARDYQVRGISYKTPEEW